MLKTGFIRSIGLLVFCVYLACTPGTLTEEELKQYVLNPGKGLLQEREKDGIGIKLTYKPTDLLVARELSGEKQVSEKMIKKWRTHYSQYAYFVLSISEQNSSLLAGNVGSKSEFAQRVQLLSFELGEYAYLCTNTNDTVPIADYVYPRMYAATPVTTMLLAFRRDKLLNADWIEFNLDDIGLGIGRTRFKFKMKYLNKVPVINFNNNKI